MMKIRDEEILDYMDGTLDSARRAEVEAHLSQDAELSAMLSEMPLAMAALRDWDESESAASTRDLWPQIREQLPARAGSSLGRMLPRPARKSAASTRDAAPQTSLLSALFPAKSPWKMSARIAAVAAFVALAALALSPRGSVQNVKAEKLTSAEQTFIAQSVQRHAAYETVRSVNGATLGGGTLTNSDGRSSDGDDEPDDPTDAPYSP